MGVYVTFFSCEFGLLPTDVQQDWKDIVEKEKEEMRNTRNDRLEKMGELLPPGEAQE